MVTPNREPVIENIKRAVEEGNFNTKVEIGDPVLTGNQRSMVLKHYLNVRKTPMFFVKNFIAGRMADIMTWKLNANSLIDGFENIKNIKGGAIITTNHFNPAENTIIRLLSQKMKKGNLYVVSQDTNLKMGGFLGFFLYYMDIIPVSRDTEYMTKHFDKLISEAFKKGQNILIYPEQEMWFNYRKPRPPKRGAYFYAAKHNVPVISCFTEIRQLPEMETEDFHKVQYVLHVLSPIYPNPEKSVRENSIEMAQIDYEQKKAAYEAAYGKKLDYTFSDWDIAGWVGKN